MFFTDTVFITSMVTLFFKSVQNRKLIKLLLLPVRGTSFTVFENSQCFWTCTRASLLKSPNAHSSLREAYLLKFRKCSTTETLDRVFERITDKLNDEGGDINKITSLNGAYDHRRAEIYMKKLWQNTCFRVASHPRWDMNNVIRRCYSVFDKTDDVEFLYSFLTRNIHAT